MSIVSEALKRAHFDAIRHEREQRRPARTPGTLDYPEPRPSRRQLVIAVTASNISLILVAGLVVHVRSLSTNPATPRHPAPRRAVSLPLASAAAPTASSDPKPVSRPSLAPPPKPVLREAPSNAGSVKHKTSPSPAAAAPSTRATSASPKTRDGLTDGRTYVQNLPLADGDYLTLNGITVAGDRGAALINGRVVWEGERVGQFLVRGVQRKRVELRYHDITVFVTLP